MKFISFSKEKVQAMAAEGLTVPEMAKKMNVDATELETFYAECYKEDANAFPCVLLITKPWLEEKLATMPVYKIAKTAGCSASLIRRLMVTYGLEAKPKLNELLTPEVLYSLFVEEKLRDKEIAKRYNCSVESIKKLRSKHNITDYSRRDSESDISIEYFHHLYAELGFSPKYIAKMMGCPLFRVKTLRTEFANSDHPLAQKIANTKRLPYTYSELIELLMKNVEPDVLFELLKDHTIAEVAEMYRIIPAAEPGIPTFTKEWLEIVLHRMNITQIISNYHIGRTFIAEMMKENDLSTIPLMDRIDEETVRCLFIDNGWSDEKIASALGVSKNAIVIFRQEKGIKMSARKSLDERLTYVRFRHLYLDENLTLSQIAELYDTSVPTVSLLKHDYEQTDSDISGHTSKGASAERLQYLKKQLKFEGMKK